MFRRYLISILIIFSVIFIGCSPDENDVNKKKLHFQITPLSETNLVQYQQCQSDNDCMYINNGCCDCANSGATIDGQSGYGQEIAINKSKKTEFEAQFSCHKLMGCTQRARIPMCGDGKVNCQKNNLCNFTLQE